jgi:hypothetical protein
MIKNVRIAFLGCVRGGNRAGQVRFGFRSDGSDEFDFLEEIGSGRIELIYILCFFISLIDFN